MKKSNVNELKHLYRWRELQDKERLRVANSFDKYLLTFATGTLYLSVTLSFSIRDILINKNIIIFGWTCLIISITSILIAIFLSDKAFSRGIDITDNIIRDVLNGRKSRDEENCWNTITVFLQVVGIVTFIVGIILLSVFYFYNLP